MDAYVDSRLDRVEKMLALPTLLTVGILLVLLLLPLLMTLDQAHQSQIWWAQVIVGLVFVVEYGVRLGVAERKEHFVRTNVIDTVVAVSSVALPLFPDLRFLLALRVVTAISLILEVGKDFQHLFRVKNVPYALVGATLVVIVCGALEYHYENPAKGSNINTTQDGLWWAIVTMSTVGYGDKYPITNEGRAIAVVLMTLGPVFLGILYAGLTTTFMRPTEEELAEQHRSDDERLARIVEQTVLDRLKPISEKLDRALGLIEASAKGSRDAQEPGGHDG
jgi:voltage-gated potassium channel